ncbi:MAG TPA: hypothetical protein VGK67_18905 [Myxococcales bacterium]|jgi:hypothetical protein
MAGRFLLGETSAGSVPFLARQEAPEAALSRLLRASARLSALASFLDGLTLPSRISAVRSLSRRELVLLWEVAARGRPPPWSVRLFYPEDFPRRLTFEWVGLEAGHLFLHEAARRFTRGPAPDELVGHDPSVPWPAGPGYFRVRASPARAGDVFFDYSDVPRRAPPGWPAPRTNEHGLASLAYGNRRDHVRAVGSHVAVGRAHDLAGRPLRRWLVLARSEVLPFGA